MAERKTLSRQRARNILSTAARRTVLVRTGYGREHESQLGEATKPLAVFETLGDFADSALGQAE